MTKMAAAAEILEIVEPEEQPPEQVELDEEAPEPPITYDETAANIVADLMKTKKGQEWVKKVARERYEEFEETWKAQETYRERLAEEWRVYSGDLPPKTWPWEKCANAHLPIYATRANRLAFRVYAELFGDWTNVAAVLPVGPDDQDVSDVLTRHGNWQLQTELTDFPRQMERATHLFICAGDFAVHSYRDTLQTRNVHEVLTADEFIVPYVYTTTTPDYSDVPWYAKVLKMHRHQMQRMRGVWFDVDRVLEGEKPSFEDDPESPLAMAQSDVSGIEPEDTGRAPYKLIHWEGWMELPDSVDERFCKVVFDHKTKGVLQIQVLEEEDWKDRQRFNRQEQELGAYRDGLMQFQIASTQPPPMPQMDPMTGAMMEPPPPPQPPQPPGWAAPESLMDPEFAPEPVRKVPIHMFTHGVCIEPATGVHGIGYGKWLSDFNKAANTALSQFTDSATLANVKSFLGAGNKIGKSIDVVPGKITPIPDISPRDLQDALLPLEFGQANPQLVELVKMMMEAADEVTQAPGVLSGEEGKSGETYRGIATRVEQATKQISVVARKLARTVEQVLRNNAKLNAQFMPEEELVYISNHKTGANEMLKVGRAMYDRDYRVIIRADLRFASQAQRVAEADQLVQMPGAIPPMQQNIPFWQKSIEKALIARGADDMVQYLGPPVPPPQTPLGLPPPPPPGAPPPPPENQPGADQPQGQQPPSAPPEGPPVPPQQ